MSNFDAFKQYQSEMQRIKDKIAAEENPYHRQHIAEFSEMVDERIRTVVPQMIQEQQEEMQLNVETYLNGKRVSSSADIIRGVREIVMNAFRNIGKRG